MLASLKSARRLIGGKARAAEAPKDHKGAIAVHHTATDKDGAWDAGANLKRLGDGPATAALKAMHAWVDPDKDATTKSAYKLPHHEVSEDGKVGAAVMKGVESAMGRLNGGGLDIPEGDRKGVYAHLKAHYADADMDAPELKSRAQKTKDRLRLEIKGITEGGEFEGILSTYGNVDDGGDVVEVGAFTKTIKEHGNQVPLLWQHRPDVPIGMLTLQDGDQGLTVKGKLLMELPEAQKAYLLIKAKIVKGLSIGFDTIKDAIENGVRHLKELRLYEGSIVTFPMNESAVITAVKAAGGEDGLSDFNEELSEIQIYGAFDQMMSALYSAMQNVRYAFCYGDLQKDEAVTACAAVCEQFAEACSAWFPAYCDMMAEYYAKTGGPSETKEGRRHSAADRTEMQKACDHMKAAHEIMTALLADEAGEEDSTSKRGAAALETKSKPGDHLAAESLIGDIRALIPSVNGKS